MDVEGPANQPTIILGQLLRWAVVTYISLIPSGRSDGEIATPQPNAAVGRDMLFLFLGVRLSDGYLKWATLVGSDSQPLLLKGTAEGTT